jgi:hypothetical protein
LQNKKQKKCDSENATSQANAALKKTWFNMEFLLVSDKSKIAARLLLLLLSFFE